MPEQYQITGKQILNAAACRVVKRINQRTGYPRYGGRGIAVADRWLSFANFLTNMGERPSLDHSLDRHPNNNGDYTPGNCRWATEQARNRRDNHLVEYQGERLCLTEWAEKLHMSKMLLRWRLKHWGMPKAFEQPVEYRRPQKKEQQHGSINH